MSVNDKLNRIKEIKGNIKDAIVEKGVEVTDSDSFNSYADKIRAISGGGTPGVPEVKEWVKPEGWPDIKEGMKENQIRMLVCDKAYNGDIGLSLYGECTIDWGDGSEPEINAPSTSSFLSHKFNADNAIKYTDDEGLTHNMYIITIDHRHGGDVSVVNGKNMLLWYVNTKTPEYICTYLDFSEDKYLECVECTGGIEIKGMSFSYCSKLVNVKLTGPVRANAYSQMFRECSSLTSLDVSNWDISSADTLSAMFSACSSLVSIKGISNWDISNVTNVSNMFIDCSSLTSLDVSNWDTSSVTDMSAMFYGCRSLTSLDVSNWDTSSVTDMTSMFTNCSSLTSLDVSNWDTSNVTTMKQIFNECNTLASLDVSNWDTSSVTDVTGIFYECRSLTSLDVSNWDTSSVTDMSQIFYGCESLREIKRTEWDFSSFTGSGYSSKCKNVFQKNKLRKLDLTLQNSVDQTSTSYLPLNVSSSLFMQYYHNFSLTIPRPTFKFKIEMSSGTYKNLNLQHLIIKGQDGMTFTAASPQITLDNTYAFKEEQINEFFTNLPTVTNSPTISLKNNPHAGYANMGIALEKGWNVLYDSATNSASTIPLDDEGQPTNLPLAYRFIPGEDGTFVDANGNKCNLLYSQSVATMNPAGWEMLPTFEDALNKYGIEVEEEYREEIAKDVLAYANDDSLVKRYNIELD